MTASCTLGNALILSAAVIAAVVGPQPVAAQPASAPKVALRFNWPVGLRLKLERHQLQFRAHGDKVDTSETTWAMSLAVERHTEGRLIVFSGLQRLKDSAAAVPIAAISHEAQRLLPGLLVADNAEPLRLERFDLFAMAIRHALAKTIDTLATSAPGFAQLVERMVSPDLILAKVSDDWSLAVSFWANEDLEIGEVYEYADSASSPIAPEVKMPYQYNFSLRSRMPCDPGRADSACVLLALVSRPQPAALLDVMKRVVAQVGGSRAGGWTVDSASALTHARIVSEPASLIPHQVIFEQQAEWTMRGPRDSVQHWRQVTVTRYRPTYEREPTPLHVAAAAGDEGRVAALLRGGVRPDTTNFDGETPLYVAATGGHAAVARRLVGAGANAERAYELARSRGMLRGMRVLRAHIASPPRPPATPDVALRLLQADSVVTALPMLADSAIAEATPSTAHAWLAESLRRLRRPGEAVGLARAVLANRPCHTLAHMVVGRAYDPLETDWSGSDPDTAAAHVQKAVACDSTNADAWSLLARHAVRSGDAAAYTAALRRMVAAGSISATGLAFGRWLLQALPKNAIVITEFDIETQALRAAQVVDGERPDVMVVNRRLLDFPRYVRLVRDQSSVPLPLTPRELDALIANRAGHRSTPSLGARIVHHWRELHRDGMLTRPIASTLGVRGDSLTGPGWFAPSGAMALLQADSDTVSMDPLLVWATFARAPAARRQTGAAPLTTSAGQQLRDMPAWAPMGAATYVISLADYDYARYDRARLAAVDSLTTFAHRSAAAMPQPFRTALVPELARPLLSIAARLLTLGDPREAQRQARRATLIYPTLERAWNSLGYMSLLLGDLELADTALRRADQLAPSLSAQLNLAVVARLKGRLDEALVRLRTAESTAVGERLEDVSYMYEWWVVNYLPRFAGDTVTIRRTGSARTIDERVSFIHYGLGIVHAMRGDFKSADAALARALTLGGTKDVRCFMAANMESAGAFVRLAAPSQAWLSRHASKVRRGFDCAQ
jgi:tetratricopeptide (TPR) repeat protein